MEKITLHFYKNVPPDLIKSAIEKSVKNTSPFRCNVEFIEAKGDVNIFDISSKDGPYTFYLIGMAVSAMIRKNSPSIN